MGFKKPLIMEQKVIANIIKNYFDELARNFPNPDDYVKQLDNFKKNIYDDDFIKQIDPDNELRLTISEKASLKMYIDDAIKKYNEGQLDGTSKISADIKTRIDSVEDLFYRTKGSFNPEKQQIIIRKLVYVAKDADSVLRVINGVEGIKSGIDDTIESANLIDDATIKAISEDETLYNGLLDANATQMWNNLEFGKTKDNLPIDLRTYFDEISFKNTFKQKLKEKYDLKINEYKNKGKDLEIDNNKNLEIKEIDTDIVPEKFLGKIYEFLTTMDDVKKVSILKTLKEKEKEILNKFIKDFADEISFITDINKIDDLFDVSKTGDLFKLGKVMVDNSTYFNDSIYKFLGTNRYPSILSLLDKDNFIVNTIKKDGYTNSLEEIINQVKKNNVEDIGFSDLDNVLNSLKKLLDITDDIQEKNIINQVTNDIKNIANDVNSINFSTRSMVGIPNYKTQQVSGIKIKQSEIDNINRILDERSEDWSWGWSKINEEPVHEIVKVNGVSVKFTVSEEGPRQLDTFKAVDDRLYDNFEEEYIKWAKDNGISENDVQGWDKFFFQKFKNTNLLDVYLPKYEVSAGVRLYDYNGDPWIVINPVAMRNREDLNFVTFHEMTHVDQKSLNYRIEKYRPETGTPEEALEYLNFKKTRVEKIDDTKTYFLNRYRILSNSKTPYIIEEYKKLFNVPNDFLSNFDLFKKFSNWCYENKKYDMDMYNVSDNVRRIETPIFSNKLKKDAIILELEKMLKNSKETFENLKSPEMGDSIIKLERKISMIKSLEGEKLDNFLKNNINDPQISLAVKGSAENLGYWLSVVEIEAEFVATIREVMNLGKTKQNVEFAKWLITWLQSSNKLEKSKTTVLKRLKNSQFFGEFLIRVESEYKVLYPKDTKKLYNKLYTQLYEVLRTSYPAVFGIVFGAGALNNQNNKTTNENIKENNNILLEINKIKNLMKFKI